MRFYNCCCYFTHNIYIKEYNWHFTYLDIEQFNKDYSKILPKIGCDTVPKKAILLQRIEEEVSRRRNKETKDAERKKFLESFYQPRDKCIYTLEEKFFHSSFIKLIQAAKQLNHQEVLQSLDIISKEKQIYGFPMFKEDFCHRFMNELDYFNKSSMPKERPNTMNQHGILLDDIGFHDNFSLPLRENYLDPLAQVLFPEWRGQGLDSHKIFTVEYRSDEDSELGYHYDNSEVTLNICLGQKFEGGELYFGDMNNIPIAQSTCILIKNKVGFGILHRGQQLHGGLNIYTDLRCNLIMWMRASSRRNKKCPKCNVKPKELFPAIQYGDGFTLSKE